MLSQDFQQDIDPSLATLQAGGLILYSTDTIWGIGCDATDAAAVEKVYALKQRAESKSLIILMADKKDILRYTSQPDLRIFDYLDTVTKPTTVIYEGAMGLAPNCIAADGTVAIRLVEDPFCRHLIKRFRKPLVSTSANISGMPAPASFKDVDAKIKAGVDYIVRHRQDDNTQREPSAIVRWNKDATITIIRS
ncbi:L-threonylcarbamoyladenylate synthase [Flavitalea sp. BT771]|uniref:L-threonylcarbamoyladenylate synthase n=1 Tax=Flavitalea sp. BT771 TaxID=3063329 RepID=UPI0026E471F1|nr:L-threonylcarbamoyladenylate synthase [Flavitalea sp. BT771]MDO6430209.1 L-threonylcarbamoyladenylate synthase [Flavitalea sp. BT771]MDV6219652.1 L-threonylcarbamoyladenylate synthase [Flavitalea sp. BT771]